MTGGSERDCGLDLRLDRALSELSADSLLRTLPPWDADGPGRVRTLDGRSLISFASNDYLGLSAHPALIDASARATRDHGTGGCASRLLAGGSAPHRLLEEKIAAFKGTEASLAFGSGTAAAMGTLASLAGPGDVVILDKLSHACLVDAAKLSGAVLRVFPHNNVDRLRHLLGWARDNRPNAGIFVVTESIFSMDGDAAPLAEIVELKDRFGAWLLLDEAHAVGVRGRGGRGLAEESGLAHRVDIQMGTLGKALGGCGGFIAGSRKLVDFLVNKARTFVFSTAPSPGSAAAGSAAIDLLCSSEGEAILAKLRAHRSPLRAESAIVPVRVGEASDALRLSKYLLEAGFYVPAIRFPTVPRGTARLRLSLSATHTEAEIEQVFNAIATVREICR